ncbi:MAG: nitrilase [Lysobacterales bacterium]|jgi:nitrilase
MTELRAGFAQISPEWLDRSRSLQKVQDWVGKAADESVQLLAFGEALVPGYPFWPDLTGGAKFESDIQKDLFAHYAEQAVDIGGGHLDDLCTLAKQRGIAVYLGCIERATDRSAHSLYASLVYISSEGAIDSVHRKLCPTYEERLVWSNGDGHGLRVHELQGFRVGGLNCWENWMPLPRASLYAQGENVHIAAWPGSVRNTHDITKFMAREGRSFVISASGLMHKDWISSDLPHAEKILDACGSLESPWLADGGSCIAGPDGEWLIEPQKEIETMQYADFDLNSVYRERQNFDPAGHYSRPDVTKLTVDRRRQNTTEFED